MDCDHIFEIYIDDKLIKQFSLETVNSYFIKNGFYDEKEMANKSAGISTYLEGFWEILNMTTLSEREEYTDDEFCNALEIYRNENIKESLFSNTTLIRMFAILDRRVGKRTLEKIKDNVIKQPKWLQIFYQLRFEAEGIDYIYGEMELTFEFFYKQLKKGMNINEICFCFKDDEVTEYYLGYISRNEKPYWVGQCDIKDGCEFYSAEELINAKIYNGQSLLECWDNIIFLSIEGVQVDEWLEFFEHC